MESALALRLLFGLKVKKIRQERGLSLSDLAERTSISVSYLSEIEKGKKYPKPDRVVTIADALGVSFDDLVSSKVAGDLSPLSFLINSPILKEFPFEFFGISLPDLVALITEDTDKAGALIRTLAEMMQSYDLQAQDFILASLRSYQKMHNNYFPQIEARAIEFLQQWGGDPGLSYPQLKDLLADQYGFGITEGFPDGYPRLRVFRSLWAGSPPRLYLNDKLMEAQRAFAVARELGYSYLNLGERALTSSWLRVQSFEQVLDNFKASYFAGAVLLPRDSLRDDIAVLFAEKAFQAESWLTLVRKHRTTPEMLCYRMSQLIPEFFGLKELYYIRLSHRKGSNIYEMTKELNMSRVQLPYGLGLNEHYCRRWLAIGLLNEMQSFPVAQRADQPLVKAQRAHFMESNAEIFAFTFARPLALDGEVGTSITLGFIVDEAFRERVAFWNDPAIPRVEVNETCERCAVRNCAERAADPEISSAHERQKGREMDLLRLWETVGHPRGGFATGR